MLCFGQCPAPGIMQAIGFSRGARRMQKITPADLVCFHAANPVQHAGRKRFKAVER